MWSGVLQTALELKKESSNDVNEKSGDKNKESASSGGGGLRPAAKKARRVRAPAPTTPHAASVARRLPLPGTTYKQWMLIAPFMYPVLPVSEASWDNLEGARPCACHACLCAWQRAGAADWLALPLSPSHNTALLVLGAKYDMPQLLTHANRCDGRSDSLRRRRAPDAWRSSGLGLGRWSSGLPAGSSWRR